MERQTPLLLHEMEIELLKQLNNGYASCYYITEDGRVYNADTGKYLQEDTRHGVKLKTEDNKYRKISIKTLYKAAYNRAFARDNVEHLDGEEWKQIDNFGNYHVSNKGRVKSYTGYEARLLKPYNTKSGYLRLDIIEDGIRQSKLLHRLVAAAFLLPPAKIDYQLHHKDFNKLNNAADNLEWLSIADHVKKHKEKEIEDGSRQQSTKSEGNNSKQRTDGQAA